MNPIGFGNKTFSGFSAYYELVHELPEVGEATLLGQCVGVVSVLVHDAVGLQSPGTLQQSRGQLLQAIFGSKVKQRGQLLITLT